MNDNTHCVIARVASNGTSDQQEWAQQAKIKWEAMETYILNMFPNEVGLK